MFSVQCKSVGGRDSQVKFPVSLLNHTLANSNNLSQHDDPTTYKKALDSPNKDQWIEAMNDEYKSLIENGTWTLCELPKDRKAIKNKWVYKTKRDSNGNIDRFKGLV